MKIKNKFIDIAGRKVGLDFKPLVVPEIGVNHGGSIEIAFKIVDAAKKVGAEIIKTQTILPNEDMSNKSKKIKINILKKNNLFDLLKKLSFNEEEEYKLKNYIEKKNDLYEHTI